MNQASWIIMLYFTDHRLTRQWLSSSTVLYWPELELQLNWTMCYMLQIQPHACCMLHCNSFNGHDKAWPLPSLNIFQLAASATGGSELTASNGTGATFVLATCINAIGGASILGKNKSKNGGTTKRMIWDLV